MSEKDFSVLFVPCICILVFLIKYLVQRLYACHSAKLEAERMENLHRILRNNPLTESFEDLGETEDIEIQVEGRSPPPDYEAARRYSFPVSYIKLEDSPPPTYEECMKKQVILPSQLPEKS